MSFRTVIIKNQAKLNYKNRYLVVKQELEEKYIHISEIDTIIVDSISVSLSTYLLKELSKNKINIIFCDEKHNPFGELASYYGKYNTSKMLNKQIKWKTKEKDKLWSLIIKNKITNQAQVLKILKKDGQDLMMEYALSVKNGDITNREGHAAKVYFKSLFGKNFIRHNHDDINAALNYGYSILLSYFNKELISNGVSTKLGIHHKNEFNDFNFSCDLMEPFRVIIDHYVYLNKNKKFNSEYKMNMIDLFNKKFKFSKKAYTLKDIIKLYVKNMIDFLEEEKEYTGFTYEE